MKGTPFKIRRPASPQMQADAGLGGGQIPIDPNAGEGSVDPKVGRVKQSEIDYKKGEKKAEKTASQVQDVANFLPIAGEVIDAKNAVKDLIKGDYGGAALNAAGFAIPFIPGSVVKGGVKKLMSYIRKQPGAEEAIKKGEDIIQNTSKNADQMNVKGGVNANNAPTGINPNTGYKYDMDVLDTSAPIPSFTKANLNEVEIPRMKQLGKSLDNSNFDVTSLTKDNITFKGRSGGRTIVEVDLGNGQKQLFYKSTGSAGKAGSGVGGSTEGLWQPYAGHSNSAGSKGWFGKDSGYKDWYKSKSYQDISGNLDVLSTQKGINLDMQMDLSTDLSKAARGKPYNELTNAELNEAFVNYKKRVGVDQANLSIIQ